ncbi:APC family permease [Phytohabitans sp. ZYX-F-186]|uniref:APC family permease n=1 Tax=Phytohabitans maris TaxID=3071409 RepID=A0ABU0ZC97_9ACTN|nr:APC family permease [Phytohabitans sp. ZYX-F-186]MDQ7904683.1 APC family permease [Phytohabitans sp. ZYX-F-186]
MIVFAGGIPALYGQSGVVGVPLALLLAAGAVGVLLVGYVAVGRRQRHSAPFYAVCAAGLGRPAAVAAGVLGLVVYGAIGASILGLSGATLAAEFGGPWPVWAAATLLVVAGLGGVSAVNVRLLTVVQVPTIAVLAAVDVVAVLTPADGALSAALWSPASLAGGGVGLVVALGFAACLGLDVVPAFSEEARGEATVARATAGAVVFAGLFYALSAYAVAVAVGPARITAGAGGGVLPFGFLTQRWWPLGALLAGLAGVLLMASIGVAMLAFGNVFARYVYSLARDGVLPAGLARVGAGRNEGAPVGGVVVYAVAGGLLLTVFALVGADPVDGMFTWLSVIAAVGLLVLLTGANLAALTFFRRMPAGAPWLVRVGFPLLGVAVGGTALVVTVSHLDSLVGSGSGLVWLVPGVCVVAVLVGVGRAVWLRSTNPLGYGRLGQRPDPFTVPDRQLSGLGV